MNWSQIKVVRAESGKISLEHVSNKSRSSLDQVSNRSRTGFDQVPIKSRRSLEQVLIKSDLASFCKLWFSVASAISAADGLVLMVSPLAAFIEQNITGVERVIRLVWLKKQRARRFDSRSCVINIRWTYLQPWKVWTHFSLERFMP